MRRTNVIIFSSGVSEKRGLVQWLKDELEKNDCNCFCWRDLFNNAKCQDHIALLPMLIKKIPTFDFAILVCEGHDKTVVLREGKQIEASSMRDNVLFEIGLCSVALGLDKVILLADEAVRLPEDLSGLNGALALKRITLPIAWENHAVPIETLEGIVGDITEYFQETQRFMSPAVIGAAAATASGYVTSFIFRVLECIHLGFIEKGTDVRHIPSMDQISIKIHIPYSFTSQTVQAAKIQESKLSKATIPEARQRPVEFYYKKVGDQFVIEDYPTTLVTSYNTARAILRLSADDYGDVYAESRFIEKELDLFESALQSLLTEEQFGAHIRFYYGKCELEEQRRMIESRLELICDRIQIVREQY